MTAMTTTICYVRTTTDSDLAKEVA